MIIEYNKEYEENIKDLLCELQEYIHSIDKDGYSIIGKDFRELYYQKIINEVNKCRGKILLYKDDVKIVGLVVGLINNDKEISFDKKVEKRGRITELVVAQDHREKGIGTILLNAMENYLRSIGCKDILLGVMADNKEAINFYEKNNYHMGLIEMVKRNDSWEER